MQIKRKTALVAEDHEVFRMGLATILRRSCGFQAVIETASLDEAVQILGENNDVTFATFDLAMPGMQSISNLYSVRQIFPDLALTVVSASERREDIIAAITAGVHGYVPKTLNTAEIGDALNWVLEGRLFLPWSVSKLPPPSDDRIEPDAAVGSHVKLTNRQQAVLRLIKEGRSNKEIANALSLTENTVKVHANALFRALGVNSRSAAASTNIL
jgi:DNA-binding NarL/FixJ family response regulator